MPEDTPPIDRRIDPRRPALPPALPRAAYPGRASPCSRIPRRSRWPGRARTLKSEILSRVLLRRGQQCVVPLFQTRPGSYSSPGFDSAPIRPTTSCAHGRRKVYVELVPVFIGRCGVLTPCHTHTHLFGLGAMESLVLVDIRGNVDVYSGGFKLGSRRLNCQNSLLPFVK